MEALFLKIFNMSVAAGWMVLAVVFLRIVLKKAPRSLFCLLWGLVAIRLVCPFSFESVLSLVPSAEILAEKELYAAAPQINTGIPTVNSAINPIISESFAPNPGDSVNPLQVITALASWVWIVGVAAMLGYSLVSYIRLRKKVSASMNIGDNVFICDDISSPFILGAFKPRIYIPSAMDEKSRDYVISHENAHISRKDHLWKPIGFAILAIYWFDPLVWVAYILLCRDIESACDEKVVKDMDVEGKKGYSEALLICGSKRRLVSACPLAFGEVGVKQRIKGVLSYKKPAFWVIIIAIIASVILGIAFLTDPIKDNYAIVTDAETDCPWVDIEVKKLVLDGDDPRIKVKWINNSGRAILRSVDVCMYRHADGEKISCSYYAREIVAQYMLLTDGSGTSSHGLSPNMYDFTANGDYTIEYKFKLENSDTEYNAVIYFKVVGGEEKGIPAVTDTVSFITYTFTVSTLGENFAENADNAGWESDRRKLPIHLVESKDELDGLIEKVGYSFNEIWIDSSGALRNFADLLDDEWFEENCLFLIGVENAHGTGERALSQIVRYGNALQLRVEDDTVFDATSYAVNEIIVAIVDKNDVSADCRFDAYLARTGEALLEGAESGDYKITFSRAGKYEAPYGMLPCDNANDMYISSVRHLPVNKIDSREELEFLMSYFRGDALYKDIDGSTPFGVLAQKYDEYYFEENSLFLICIYPRAHNYRYHISRTTVNAKWVGFEVTETPLNVGEDVTDDNYCWIAAVEIPKSDVKTAEKISAWIG